MKKNILFLLFIMNFVLFSAEKRISEIKSLKFYVKEDTKVEKNMAKTEYWISIILPDKIKKEITFPEMNKGETYTYSKGKKKIFLPFFNQTTFEDAAAEENKILEFIADIIKSDIENKVFQEDYYKEKIKEFHLKNDEKIVIKSFQKIEGYLLPKEIKIFSGDVLISNLILSNLEININLIEKEFVI
ncbi:MAG: LolA family protein [Fusobacteriaceae bacterium]